MHIKMRLAFSSLPPPDKPLMEHKTAEHIPQQKPLQDCRSNPDIFILNPKKGKGKHQKKGHGKEDLQERETVAFCFTGDWPCVCRFLPISQGILGLFFSPRRR